MKNALDGRNAPVSQNLSEQDDLDEKNLLLLDVPNLMNLNERDARNENDLVLSCA
jgi:hypothetical protein